MVINTILILFQTPMENMAVNIHQTALIILSVPAANIRVIVPITDMEPVGQ